MKRITVLLLVCSIFIGFTACKESTNNKETTTNSTISSEITSTESTIESVAQTQGKRENCTFRDVVWGDSIEDVKKYEKATFIGEQESNLVYEGQLMGYDCSITYSFEQGKLYNGGYLITDIYSSAGQYISAYESIKEEINQKYGTPIEDEIIELEDESLIDMAGAPRALEYGYTTYRARWKTKDTNIMLGMMAENYDITIVLSYTDINYEDTSTADGI